MQVTFLGTGSAMPVPDRVQTGLLVERGEDTLLVDCGSGVLNRLAGTDVGYEGVSTVLLTHHHLDHVADLLPLMKARWLAGEAELQVLGPPGTETLVDRLLEAHEYMQGRLDLRVRDIDVEPFSVEGFDVDVLETRHSMRCHAYRFSGANGDFTFSGDSAAFAELANFADGSAVLVHDCSFPDGIETENHPTPSQLGAVLAAVDVDRVFLTHLYPHTEGRHEEMAATVRRSVDGVVTIAVDGLQFAV